MAPKILIAGDMFDAIEFLPEWFEREGYEVQTATRGPDALALAEESLPDAIVLDTLLPELDGISVCRLLRLNPVTAAIPVLLLAGQDVRPARDASTREHAVDYATRPLEFADLLTRTARLINTDHHMLTDHERILKGMAYTALIVLPSDMVWFLTLDAEHRYLEHKTVVMERGPDAADTFHSMLQQTVARGRFSLEPDKNPFTEIITEHSGQINIPVQAMGTLPNGRGLEYVFRQFDFAYISVLPLVLSTYVVGVMVLASDDAALAESRRAQQVLNSVSSQAAVVVDNARLQAAFVDRSAQVRAEQAFRCLLLDVIGDGVIVMGDDTTITYVNQRMLALSGYTRATLYGGDIDVLFHPDTRKQLVRDLREPSRPLPAEQRLYTESGVSIPVKVRRNVIPSFNGRGEATLVVVSDVSDVQQHQVALRVQTQRLRAINQASQAVASASSFEDVVQITLDAALKVVRAKTALLLLRDTDELDTLTAVSAVGARADIARDRQVNVGQGVLGTVAATGEAQLVADVTRAPAIQAEYARIYGAVASVLAVPLIAFDEVIGVLEVLDKSSGRFDSQDLGMLESLAAAAAITIENMRLFEQTRDRVTALSTLLDASSAVTSTLDFSDILERIARRLGLALHVQRVVIANWSRSSDQLTQLSELVNAYWLPEDGPRHARYALPVTYALLTSGYATEYIVNPNGNAPVERNPSGLYAMAGYTLMINREIVGVLTLYSECQRDMLSTPHAIAVREVIEQWHQVVTAYASEQWLSRPNLTDLCQRALHAAGENWVSITLLDREMDQIVVLREMGYALWSDQSLHVWPLDQHPTLARVLDTGEPLVAQRAHLYDDPGEQAYLQDVGGYTCLLAPLMMRGESGGVVKLIDTEDAQRDFTNAELSLCQGIANVVGNAMENAQLYAAQEQRASALEAAYKELQDADQLKEDLLQNLSHELRTPLTHILGYLRLTLDGAFGALNDEQHETLGLVTGKAEELATLVKDIVSVSESEMQNLLPKPMHLDRVIATAIRTTAAKAHAQGIRIQPRIPANLPLVYADPVRVGEVFEELIENALKFGQNTDSIDVTVDDPGGLMLRACVRDYGIGIPPEEHEKIFRRFYQVESGTTRRFGGTGLGLTIVRQVVEGHNGRVWVESATGQGSSFYLTLPKATSMSEDAE